MSDSLVNAGRVNERVRVWQYNCNKDKSVLLDLQKHLDRGDVDVVLIQEPYSYLGMTRGLSTQYRMYEGFQYDDRGTRAVVVVCNRQLDAAAVEELRTTVGVCVRLKGWFGVIHVVSLYYNHRQQIEEQISFLNRVLRHVRGGRLLVGMDANAISSAWFCKSLRNDSRKARGDKLSEWIELNSRIVLNVATDRYTYSGRSGHSSDIDVTLRSTGWNDCAFE